MKTIQQAFSAVNTSLGDEGMNSTGLAWYIDAAQYILNDIARACHAWQREKWYYISHSSPDAFPQTQNVNVPATNFVTKNYISVPDGALYTFPVQPAAAKSVTILPMYIQQDNIILAATDAPRSIMRVTRNQYECKELPLASVMSNYDLNRPFPNNDTILESIHFGTRVRDDDSIELKFAEPFAEGETVYILYTSSVPLSYTVVTALDRVPEWVYPALEEGIKFKLAERFFNRGSDMHRSRMEYAMQRYEKLKYDAIQYSRNLIDRRSTLTMQPIKWLPDYNAPFY